MGRIAPYSTSVETHTRPAHTSPMEEQPAKSAVAPKKPRRPSKLVIDGIEIQRPAMPPVTPLWRIQRGVEIAYRKLAADREADE
jgi:hypothetical protein